MQALKTVLLACLYSTWFGISSLHSGDVSLWTGYTNVAAWLLLFYSALGPGTIADIVQQKGQSFVSAAEANVIIAMEPVFTSILGFIILGEAMTLQEFLGGGLLIVAAILATT
jgi:drug/metabolite transporter (DMT)-like permease